MRRQVITEAERQQARFHWLTPAQAGELIGGISSELVRQHIEDGELAALDVSKKGADRREYRIKPEWVDAFNKRRTKNGDKAA